MDSLPKSSEIIKVKPTPRRRHSSEGATMTGLKKVFTENTEEFCTNTTLHGLKYVADKQLYPVERIFFGASCIAVVVISLFFISNVYSKWRSTPVILSLNPVPTVISKDPFPAVTICNLNQAVKGKVQQFKNDTIEYAMLQTLCHREVNMTVAKTMNWNMLEQFIVNISQPCSSLLLSCRFGAIDYNCSEIFRPIVTDAGLCCVFNMVHPMFMYIPQVSNILNISYSDGSVPVNWDPEDGYPDKLPPKFYPRTAAGTGENLGFTVILNVESSDYYCSASNGIGLKIFLHSPTETPHVKEVGLFLAAGAESKLRIRAEKFETDLKLRSMDKHHRRCLFDSEGDLVYFSYYTKRNCEMECLTTVIMKNCGCVSHYMPKMYVNGSICGVREMACVEKYRRISMLSDENLDDCHDLCWASCFDLTFDPDLFTIPISHLGFSVEHQLVQNFSSEYAAKNIAIVHMFFKENTYRGVRQTEFIGTTDFLSSIGGLMGLFLGFSFISLAEFIYYACIRPYYNIRRNDHLKLMRNAPRNSNASRRQEATKNLQKQCNEYFNNDAEKSAKFLNVPPKASIFAQRNSLNNSGEYYGLDVNKWIPKKSPGLVLQMNNN